MSADQVTPVTSNEREMQSCGACGLHGIYVGRRCPRCAQISEVEGTVPSAWYLDMKRERDRLVAALSAATTERDEARERAGERMVTSDYGAYVAAEARAVAAERALAQTQEVLTEARTFIERARPLLGIGMGNSLGKQADDLYVRLGAALSRRPTVQEQDEAEAEREFLTASVAVWRSIDEREAMPGGYSAQPLMQDTELRKVERAAWERYRDACAAAGEAT